MPYPTKMAADGRHWNCKPNAAGTGTEFHADRWVNVLDSRDQWVETSAEMQADGLGFSARELGFGTFIPRRSGGTATFGLTNRVDLHAKRGPDGALLPGGQAANADLITDPSLEVSMRALGLASNTIDGQPFDYWDTGEIDARLYPDAFQRGVSLLYHTWVARTPQVQRLIKIDAPLVQDLVVEQEVTFDAAVDILRQDSRLADDLSEFDRSKWDESGFLASGGHGIAFLRQGSTQRRAFRIRRAKVWDSHTMSHPDQAQRRPIPGQWTYCPLDIRRVAPNQYVLRKTIPAEFTQRRGIVFPCYADETFDVNSGSGGIDGFVHDSDSVWNTVHDSTSGTADNTGTEAIMRSREQAGTYRIDRAFHVVDTSGAPTGNVASAGFHHLRTLAKQDDSGSGAVHVVMSTPASDTSLVAGDFDQCGAVDAPTEGSAQINIADITASDYYDYTMNAAGYGEFDPDDYSRWGLRCLEDIDDAAPASNEESRVEWVTDDFGVVPPWVDITHAAGGGGTFVGRQTIASKTLYRPRLVGR